MRRAPGHSVSLCLLPGTTNPDASPGVCVGDGHPDAHGAAAGRVLHPRHDRVAGIAEGIQASSRRGRAPQPSLRHLSIVGVGKATIGRGTLRPSRRGVRTRAGSDGAELTLPKHASPDAPKVAPTATMALRTTGCRGRTGGPASQAATACRPCSPLSAVPVRSAFRVETPRSPCARVRTRATGIGRTGPRRSRGPCGPASIPKPGSVGNPDPMQALSPPRRTPRGQVARARCLRVQQRRHVFLPGMLIPLRWASRTPRSTTRGNRV